MEGKREGGRGATLLRRSSYGEYSSAAASAASINLHAPPPRATAAQRARARPHARRLRSQAGRHGQRRVGGGAQGGFVRRLDVTDNGGWGGGTGELRRVWGGSPLGRREPAARGGAFPRRARTARQRAVVAPRQCRGRALRARALCVAQTSLDPRALKRLRQLNQRHALPKVAAPARVAGGEGGGGGGAVPWRPSQQVARPQRQRSRSGARQTCPPAWSG